MKPSGKQGKRQRPTGYRTPSGFIARKHLTVVQQKRNRRQKH